MANHPSAEKRNRQRVARSIRTRGVRSATRTAVREARVAIAAGEKNAPELVKKACVALAKAAKKGVLHVRAAARTTSRIESSLNKSAAAK